MTISRPFKTVALTNLAENQSRRYLAIYAETEVTVDFDGGGNTFTIPAGDGKEYVAVVPTNAITLTGTGTVQEA